MKEYKVDITKEMISPPERMFRHFLFMKFETRESRKQRYAWADYCDKYLDKSLIEFDDDFIAAFKHADKKYAKLYEQLGTRNE